MAKNQYAGELSTAHTGPSWKLWADCPWADFILDPAQGITLWEDFHNALENTGGWLVAGTNPTATFTATELNGVFAVGSTGADNDEGYITSGNNEAGFVSISSTTPKKLWFEARIRPSSITDVAMFVGLSEEGLAAADTLANNTGALASKDFVGFHSDTAGPTALDCVYREESQDAVVTKATAQTIEAAAWYKLGLHYDRRFLHWYIDGVEEALTSTVTGVTTDRITGVYAQEISAATNFPDAEELAVLIGCHDGEGAAKQVEMDWIRVAAER